MREEFYFWVKYYKKHPGEIKINKKALNFKLDCSEKGRNICKGKCCRGTTEKMNPRLHGKEKIIALFRGDALKFNLITGKINKKFCAEKNLCLNYKPLECRLFPLKFDKKGVLTINYFYINLHCPKILKTESAPTIIEAMNNEVKSVLGEKNLCEIKNKMKEGNKIE